MQRYNIQKANATHRRIEVWIKNKRQAYKSPCVLYRNAFHFDTKRIPFPYKTSPVLIQNATLVEDMHLL